VPFWTEPKAGTSKKKERDQFLPNAERTRQFNKGFIIMALYKFANSKAYFLLVSTRYKDKRREQAIFIMSLSQWVLPKL